MERPTKEQIDALRAGDDYTIRLTFKRQHGECHLVGVDRRGSVISHSREAIHSILPREIKVGDRVSHTAYSENGNVVALHGDSAWVCVDGWGLATMDVARMRVIA